MPSQTAAGDQAMHVVVRPHPSDRRLSRLESRLLAPATLDAVFAFFSDARNLETLTPPWIRFRIVTPLPIAMRAGATIDYRLRIRGLPVSWQSVVSVWEPPHRFVDEQVRGPYRSWRHEHRFEAAAGGTLVSDTVDYRAPGGRLVDRLFVQPDVTRIFRYRLERLGQIFGGSHQSEHSQPISGRSPPYGPSAKPDEPRWLQYRAVVDGDGDRRDRRTS
jgi:ligand-binding SRPBCC domain-containing protein